MSTLRGCKNARQLDRHPSRSCWAVLLYSSVKCCLIRLRLALGGSVLSAYPEAGRLCTINTRTPSSTTQEAQDGNKKKKKTTKLIFKSARGATINSSQSHWREGCMGTLKFCQGPGLKTYWKHQTKEKDPPLSSGPQRTFHTVKDPTDLSTLGTCFKGLTDLPPVPASALLSPHY